MPNRPITVTLALAALALAAFAPPGQPDPKRRPNLMTPDLDFAVKELCAPWLAGTAAAEALADRQGVVEDRKAPWAAGGRAWWVGSPALTVALGEAPGGARVCTLRVTRGDPVKLRGALDAALAGWRTTFTPAARGVPPGAYAAREVLCAPPAGPHDTVRLSTGAKGAPVPMMVTIMALETREARCDPAG